MPSLGLNTSTAKTDSQGEKSCSTSPSRPLYSPITPTLDSKFITVSQSHQNITQSATAPPAPIPINFDENTDVLALKSTISILQMQRATASRDIKTLHRIKERALKEPDSFARALTSGEIKMRPDPLFNSDYSDYEDPECDDNSSFAAAHQLQVPASLAGAWEKLPAPQNIVRTPPINFAQYAVISESLDKLHSDQLARPNEGAPLQIGPGGEYISITEGSRRKFDMGVAAPYQPLRDKIIPKPSSTKGTRR
ncbi:hypothetical protein K3495_g7424 [Podosphaera aphanis]|nr:hypothetical protein K3495_g7424 [Podosphaera aphanis]